MNFIYRDITNLDKVIFMFDNKNASSYFSSSFLHFYIIIFKVSIFEQKCIKFSILLLDPIGNYKKPLVFNSKIRKEVNHC